MRDSSFDSMSRAIEESYLVLLCVTEEYKLSPNCRAVIE